VRGSSPIVDHAFIIVRAIYMYQHSDDGEARMARPPRAHHRIISVVAGQTSRTHACMPHACHPPRPPRPRHARYTAPAGRPAATSVHNARSLAVLSAHSMATAILFRRAAPPHSLSLLSYTRRRPPSSSDGDGGRRTYSPPHQKKRVFGQF
jgi:hypothetical protein